MVSEHLSLFNVYSYLKHPLSTIPCFSHVSLRLLPLFARHFLAFSSSQLLIRFRSFPVSHPLYFPQIAVFTYMPKTPKSLLPVSFSAIFLQSHILKINIIFLLVLTSPPRYSNFLLLKLNWSLATSEIFPSPSVWLQPINSHTLKLIHWVSTMCPVPGIQYYVKHRDNWLGRVHNWVGEVNHKCDSKAEISVAIDLLNK